MDETNLTLDRFSGNGAHVQEVLRAAQSELHALLRQKAETIRRIGSIKQTLAGLANLFGESVFDDELLLLLDRKASSRKPGFTRACRQVLMESPSPMCAREVVNSLSRRFPDLLQRHREPSASVTTVLNRLVQYQEARAVLDDRGRRAWQWITPPPAEGHTGVSANA
jgi:hypothetical protein